MFWLGLHHFLVLPAILSDAPKCCLWGAFGVSLTNGFNTTSCVWSVKWPQHDVLQVCHSSTGQSTGAVDINRHL